MKRFLAALAVAMCSTAAMAQVPDSDPAATAEITQTVPGSTDLSVLGGMGTLLTNFPLHLQAGVELGGAWQNYAVHQSTLVRGSLAPSASLDLALGLDIRRFIIAGFFNLKPGVNLRVDDTNDWFGTAEPVGGLSWLTGAKALYKVDRYGYTAAGVFAGYYRNHVNIIDEKNSEMAGEGFLIGPEFRFRPFAPAAMTGKLGVGLEWTELTPVSTGEPINHLGLVAMASLGFAFSWNNEPESGAYDQAFDAFGQGLSQAADFGGELFGNVAEFGGELAKVAVKEAVSQTVQHLAKEASGTSQHQPNEASGTAKHAPAAVPGVKTVTRNDSDVAEKIPLQKDRRKTDEDKPKQNEEESAAKSDSPSNTKQADSAPQPAPSKEDQASAPQLLSFKEEMLAAVNAERAKENLPPLVWNFYLEGAAEVHARDLKAHPNLMPRNDTQIGRCQKRKFKGKGCGHVGSNGQQVDFRVTQQGYQFSAVAENVAWNAQNVQEAMDGWMKSRSHKANILRENVTEIGAVRVGEYWVQVFGKSAGAVPNS